MVAPFFRVLLLADGTIAAQSPRKDFGTSRFRAVRGQYTRRRRATKGTNDLPLWTLNKAMSGQGQSRRFGRGSLPV